MKTTYREWDYPPEPRRGRHFERVEILPPEQPERRLHVRHSHRLQPPDAGVVALLACGVFVVLMMMRFNPIIVLVGAVVLISQVPQLGEAVALMLVVMAVAAWRAHRSGRPF
jgi:hypothetical protein